MAGVDANCLLATENFKLQFNQGRGGAGWAVCWGGGLVVDSERGEGVEGRPSLILSLHA